MNLPILTDEVGGRVGTRPVLPVGLDGGAFAPSLGASSAGIGRIAATGIVGFADFTPVNGRAYGAGALIDVAKPFTFVYADGVTPVTVGALIRVLSAVTKTALATVPAGMTSLALQAYSITPPSAQADNAAWALAGGDLTAYRGSLALGTPVALGQALYVKNQYIDADISLSTSEIYGELVTAGAFTAPSATPIRVLLYGL